MNKNLLKENEDYWNIETEIIDTPETEYIEENVYIDEKFIKNKDLIRVDMNLIQFPIFSKNTKRKINQVVTYFFNKNRDTYITVTPSAGDYIPGELEEKVFIALMQIMKERKMPQKFIVTATEIKERLKMNTSRYGSIIKNSLSRLATSNFSFKNTLYSSEHNGVIGEEVKTTIFSIRIITLSLKENKEYRKSIGDKRIKEIYEINFSDHFYKNIIQKGYMVYNGNTLLEIESSTARTIYMLIEKLRFSNLYLKLDTIFLIKRIPLKFEKRNLPQTIKTLEKAFQELLQRNLISNFNFLKESTWEKSEVEIFFNEDANDEKQGRFYQDKNDYRKILASLTISETQHNIIEEIKFIEEKEKDENKIISTDSINKILDLMPSKAKELKTMPRTIKDGIEKYGYSKVKAVAIYMKKNKVEKPRTYFIKALENNWVEDHEEEIKEIKEIKPIESALNISQYNEDIFKEFEKLPIEIQNGIETYTYREYIKICGIETKIQKIAFAGSRKKLICEFLEKYPEILENKKIKNEIENSKEETKENNYNLTIIEDKEELKNFINEYINLYENLLEYKDENSDEIKKKIILDSMSLFFQKTLTIEKLEKIIKKYLI